MSHFLTSILCFAGINIILAYSLYIVLLTGQLSLGNAGFMAVGAYVSSVATVNFGLPLGLGLIIGACVAGFLGLVVGIPALKLKGIYLAMGTLAFGEMTRTFFLNYEYTGGGLGFRGMVGSTPTIVWLIVVVVVFLFYILAHSRLGLILEGIGDDEIASRAFGVNAPVLKVCTFGAAGFLAGLAGGLFAHYTFFIEPKQFDFALSVDIALFAILGGMRSYLGPLLGALLFTMLPEVFRSLADWRGVAFGTALVVLLVFRSQGILKRDLLRSTFKSEANPGKEPAC